MPLAKMCDPCKCAKTPAHPPASDTSWENFALVASRSSRRNRPALVKAKSPRARQGEIAPRSSRRNRPALVKAKSPRARQGEIAKAKSRGMAVCDPFNIASEAGALKAAMPRWRRSSSVPEDRLTKKRSFILTSVALLAGATTKQCLQFTSSAAVGALFRITSTARGAAFPSAPPPSAKVRTAVLCPCAHASVSLPSCAERMADPVLDMVGAAHAVQTWAADTVMPTIEELIARGGEVAQDGERPRAAAPLACATHELVFRCYEATNQFVAANKTAGLLWVARSAVACPGCPWGDVAWDGGCALISRWWSAPAAPSCRGSRFDSSCRALRHGGTPLLLRGVGHALSTLAASPPPPSLTPTPRRRDATASSTATSSPSPPSPSPSPPHPTHRRRRRRRRRRHCPCRRRRRRRRRRRPAPCPVPRTPYPYPYPVPVPPVPMSPLPLPAMTPPQPQPKKPTMPSARRRRCCHSCRGALTTTRRCLCRHADTPTRRCLCRGRVGLDSLAHADLPNAGPHLGRLPTQPRHARRREHWCCVNSPRRSSASHDCREAKAEDRRAPHRNPASAAFCFVLFCFVLDRFVNYSTWNAAHDT
jgi:hypothetical protein